MTTNTATLFAIDTRTHRMEIAHDHGLYRHLKFRAHDEDGRPTGIGWFDLITAPGTLTFVGDYEAVTFRRLDDMFEFFRSSAHRGEPNFGYWAEKVASGGARSVMEYDEDVFRKTIKEHVADDIRTGQAPRGIGRALHESFLGPDSWEYDLTHEAGARAALDDFEYEGYHFRDCDAWEWSFEDYTHAFKWACYAIIFGIGMYDTAKAVASAA